MEVEEKTSLNGLLKLVLSASEPGLALMMAAYHHPRRSHNRGGALLTYIWFPVIPLLCAFIVFFSIWDPIPPYE